MGILLLASSSVYAQNAITDSWKSSQETWLLLLKNPLHVILFLFTIFLVLRYSFLLLKYLLSAFADNQDSKNANLNCSWYFFSFGIVLYFFIHIIFSFLFQEIHLAFLDNDYARQVSSYILATSAWCAYFLWYIKNCKPNIDKKNIFSDFCNNLIKQFSIPKISSFGTATLSYFSFFPCYWIAYLITLITFGYFNFPIQSQEVANQLLTAQGIPLILGIISILIIAPISEEMLFRCYIYGYLRPKIGKIHSIIFTSIIFAVIHGSTFVILPIAVLGIFLNLLYERSQQIWLSIFVHSLHNTLTMLYLFYGI